MPSWASASLGLDRRRLADEMLRDLRDRVVLSQKILKVRETVILSGVFQVDQGRNNEPITEDAHQSLQLPT